MAVLNTGRPYNSGIDANNYPTLTAVSGTIGTADTAGTAEIFAIGGNPTTGALYVQDLSGAGGTTTVQMVSGTLNVGTVVVSSSSGGTNVNVITGTQQLLTTVSNLTNGSINVLSGTLLNTGTNINVVTGTLLNTGTVINVATGTQQLLTTVSNLTNGSINVLTGTQQLLTTVSNLTNGSINVLTGTVNALVVGTIGGKAASGAAAVANPVQIGGTDAGGTIYSPLVTTGGILAAVMPTGTVTTIAAGTQNTLGTVGLVNGLVTGTITTGSLSNVAMLNAGTIVQASGTTTLVTTVTTLSNVTNGSINILTGTLQSSGTTTGVGVVSNVTNGSINLLTGTVTSVSNLAAGTVQINPVPIPTILTFGTLGTAGGSFFATISAASGAGTKHYVSGVDVVMQSGTADVRVLAGSAIQGTGVLAAGQFPAGAGISPVFNPAFATGTNSELIYHFVGAGTAFIVTRYWRGV